jgi:hypothetical protein
VRHHPSLAGYQVAAYAALERDLAELVAARQEAEDPYAHMRARLVAAAYLSALRIALQTWLDDPSGPALPEVLREALNGMAQRFR